MRFKTTSVLLLLLGLPIGIKAQAALFAAIFGDQVATDKFNLSLELAVPFGAVSNIDDLSRGKGFAFGIAGNIKLSQHWFLSPSAYFVSGRSVYLDNVSLNSPDPNLNQLYQNVDADYVLNYIDIPIFIHYRLKEVVEFGLAPKVAFRQRARAIYKNDLGEFTQSIGQHTARVDYGLVFSLGYFFKYGSKGNGLHLYARYYQGLADTFDDDFHAGDNYNNYFSVVFSLPFLTPEKAFENYRLGQREKADKKARRKRNKNKK